MSGNHVPIPSNAPYSSPRRSRRKLSRETRVTRLLERRHSQTEPKPLGAPKKTYETYVTFWERLKVNIAGICRSSYPATEHRFQSNERVFVEACKKYGTVLAKFPGDLYQVKLDNGLVSNFCHRQLSSLDNGLELKNRAARGAYPATEQDGVSAVQRFAGVEGLAASPHYAPLRGRTMSTESIGLKSDTDDPDYTPPVPRLEDGYVPPSPVVAPAEIPRTPRTPTTTKPAPAATPSFEWNSIATSIRSLWTKVTSSFESQEVERPRILVLGASPLQLEDQGSLSPLCSPRVPQIQKLNLSAERRMIRSVSEDAGSPCDIEFSYLNAVKLKTCMLDPPDILQLTGHGVSDAGSGLHYLALEKQDGSTHFLTPEQLRPLVEDRAELPSLVVLGACYSERFGKIFMDAGVPHVVCCKEEVLDSTLLHFERGFYTSLLKGETVKQSFDEGVRYVQSNCDCESKVSSPSLSRSCAHDHCSPLHCLEVDKLHLLPATSPHDDVLVDSDEYADREHPGLIRSDSAEPSSLPAATQPFVGRAEEMQRLMSKLSDPTTRCVCLTGEALIGKSAVAVQACHYMRKRCFFSKIHYVDVSDSEVTISSVIGEPDSGEAMDKAEVARKLQSEPCLVLVDNCTVHTTHELLEELVYLMKNTYKPKFIITSRQLLDFESTDGMDASHILVRPFDNREGVELIGELYPELLHGSQRDVNQVIAILNFSGAGCGVSPEKIRKMVVEVRRRHMLKFRRRLCSTNNNISIKRIRSSRRRRNSCGDGTVCVSSVENVHRAVAIRKRSMSID